MQCVGAVAIPPRLLWPALPTEVPRITRAPGRRRCMGVRPRPLSTRGAVSRSTRTLHTPAIVTRACPQSSLGPPKRRPTVISRRAARLARSLLVLRGVALGRVVATVAALLRRGVLRVVLLLPFHGRLSLSLRPIVRRLRCRRAAFVRIVLVRWVRWRTGTGRTAGVLGAAAAGSRLVRIRCAALRVIRRAPILPVLLVLASARVRTSLHLLLLLFVVVGALALALAVVLVRGAARLGLGSVLGPGSTMRRLALPLQLRLLRHSVLRVCFWDCVVFGWDGGVVGGRGRLVGGGGCRLGDCCRVLGRRCRGSFLRLGVRRFWGRLEL
mmetsp:Transcript_23756/g.62089  ORF Transcript_23756/g.62089 Transcript_23756/m.62089 type:complete len:326 (-) Transcript_23756:621-1598(-)